MLIAQLVLSSFMCGVIWIIQVLHYPGFLDIDPSKFSKFHSGHSRRITFIVAPVMVAELMTAGFLLIQNLQDVVLILNMGLLAGIWITTFAVSVPLHDSLAKRMDTATITKLVRTNWLRTAMWTLRAAILCWYVSHA